MSEKTRLPFDHPVNKVGRKVMNGYTLIQLVALGILWAFKSNSSTAIFFPSVIGFLIALRSWVLPKIFTEEELVSLGDASPRVKTVFS